MLPCRLALLLCVVLLDPVPAHAQQSAPSERVGDLHFVSFGGFLGYLDGFPEYPSGPWLPGAGQARALGGVIGVKQWLADHPDVARAPRLVSGGNMPRYRDAGGVAGEALSPTSQAHTFWQQLLKLSPAVVALGDDDLLRGVEADAGAGQLARLAASAELPFLASNVFIRETGDGLNIVRSRGLTLDVSETTSLLPQSDLAVHCGSEARCRRITGAQLTDVGPVGGAEAPRPAQQLTVTDRPDTEAATFALPQPLRPGRIYRLTLGEAAFSFRTSRPLTPGTSGLPVRRVAVNSAPFVVVAFVSPDVKEAVAPVWWTWTRQGDGVAPCYADECELDVVAPVEAWAWLDAWRDAAADEPVLAMLPGDEGDTAFLEASPGVRVAILAPDSSALGRVALPESRRYSGDLGYHGILNSGRGARRSQIWLRPEWIGETVHEVKAETVRAGALELRQIDPFVDFVNGVALRYRAGPGRRGDAGEEAPRVQYYVRDRDGQALLVGTPETLFAPYTPTSSFANGMPHGELWTRPEALQAFILDAVRGALKTDVGVLDSSSLDNAVVGWLSDEVASRPVPELRWLSRFVLERAIDRVNRFVRVDVPGSGLAALIGNAMAQAESKGATLCVLGMGIPCPVTTLSGGNLRINDRDLDARQFYSVALPVEYAQAMAVDAAHSPIELQAILDVAARRFRVSDVPSQDGCAAFSDLPGDCAPEAGADAEGRRAKLQAFASDGGPSLQARLERTTDRRARYFLRFDQSEFEFKQISVGQPAGVSFKGVPEEGRDVRDQLALTGRLAGDIAADLGGGWILRGLGVVAFGRQEVDGAQSYPDDDWKVTGRVERLLERGPVHALLAGYTIDSQFRRTIAPPSSAVKVDASTDGRIVTMETLALVNADGRGWRPTTDLFLLGVQFEPLGAATRAARLTDLTFMAAQAFRRYDITGLEIAGEVTSADMLSKVGETQVVTDAFRAREAALRADPTVRYLIGETSQTRLELAATLTLTPPQLRSGARIVVNGSGRYYAKAKEPDRAYTPSHAFDLRLQWQQPLGLRFAVAPYVSVFGLSTQDTNSRFTVVETGIKFLAPFFSSKGLARSRR